RDNLFAYSSAQLQQYFDYHHYSEKDILEQNVLYMSDEFVKLAKTYPGYYHAIKGLYKQLKRMGAASRLINIANGSYCAKLFKRVLYLYKETELAKKFITEKAEQFANTYNINLIELFPYNGTLATQDM